MEVPLLGQRLMGVQEPSRQLRRYALRVRTALEVIAESRDDSGTGAMEAPRHAWGLSNALLRTAQAVCRLAEADIRLVAPAYICTRGCVELASRILWLLAPDDRWEREARWLLLLEEGNRGPISTVDLDFVQGVRAKLPPATRLDPGVPSLKKILEEVGHLEMYRTYRVLSQYVHGADLAVTSSRRGHGIYATWYETYRENDWADPLSLAWTSVLVTQLKLQEVGQVITADLPLLMAQVEDAKGAFRRSIAPDDREGPQEGTSATHRDDDLV